jgi:hypothetical protein
MAWRTVGRVGWGGGPLVLFSRPVVILAFRDRQVRWVQQASGSPRASSWKRGAPEGLLEILHRPPSIDKNVTVVES